MGPQKRFSRPGHIFFVQNSLCRIKMPFAPPVNTRHCGALNNLWLAAGPLITGLQSSRNAVKSLISGHCSAQTESTSNCFTKVPQAPNIQADSFFQASSVSGQHCRSLNPSGFLLPLIFGAALSRSPGSQASRLKKEKAPAGVLFLLVYGTSLCRSHLTQLLRG